MNGSDCDVYVSYYCMAELYPHGVERIIYKKKNITKYRTVMKTIQSETPFNYLPHP